MFENAGRKIKSIAKAWFVIQCVAAFVGGIAVISADEDLVLLFLLILGGGFLVAWISSLLLYGFGEIVDTAIENRYVRKVAPQPKTVVNCGNSGVQRVPTQPQAQSTAPHQAVAGSDSWVCPACKTKNLATRTTCWSCGKSVSENA